MTVIEFAVPTAEVLNTFVVPGEPVSKARARFTNYRSPGRVYTPEKTLTAERNVRAAYVAAGGRLDPSTDLAYGVIAHFYCGTRQRRDIDNMAKLILDGLNGVAWPDDVQVLELTLQKTFAPSREEARTEVTIYRAGDMNKPSKDCEHCGTRFNISPSIGSKRFCSQECRVEFRRIARTRECEQCGVLFEKEKSHAKYCSMACRRAATWLVIKCDACGNDFDRRRCHRRVKNYCSPACREVVQRASATRSRLSSQGVCATCGGPTSKKKYLNCDACKQYGKKVPR